jgi:hypothetical protein
LTDLRQEFCPLQERSTTIHDFPASGKGLSFDSHATKDEERMTGDESRITLSPSNPILAKTYCRFQKGWWNLVVSNT